MIVRKKRLNQGSTFFLHFLKRRKGATCIHVAQHFTHFCGSPEVKQSPHLSVYPQHNTKKRGKNNQQIINAYFAD